MPVILVESFPGSFADLRTITRLAKLVREDHICGKRRVELGVPQKASTAGRGLEGVVGFDHVGCFGEEPEAVFFGDCAGFSREAVDV
jgi:hypothetical protein